jgi:hypothetical protein
VIAGLVPFLAGAVAFAYVVAAVFFLRFWKRTGDRLFLWFGWAFLLFALNQAIVILLDDVDERVSYAYVLRVVGFGLILAAIVRKNLAAPRRDRRG